MGLFRNQRPDESASDYEIYREVRRLEYNAQKKAYYEAYYKDKKKACDLKRRYGLNADEYNNLLSKGCEVCGSFEKLCVDHCHETGKVRGCLCNSCNVALGHMKDDPKLVQQLLNYIEVHK
jgi:hypothetical protein